MNIKDVFGSTHDLMEEVILLPWSSRNAGIYKVVGINYMS